MDGWMDGWMDEWMEGWMQSFKYVYMYQASTIHLTILIGTSFFIHHLVFTNSITSSNYVYSHSTVEARMIRS